MQKMRRNCWGKINKMLKVSGRIQEKTHETRSQEKKEGGQEGGGPCGGRLDYPEGGRPY